MTNVEARKQSKTEAKRYLLRINVLNERLLSKAMVDHGIVHVAHMSKLFEQYD